MVGGGHVFGLLLQLLWLLAICGPRLGSQSGGRALSAGHMAGSPNRTLDRFASRVFTPEYPRRLRFHEAMPRSFVIAKPGGTAALAFFNRPTSLDTRIEEASTNSKTHRSASESSCTVAVVCNAYPDR